MIPVETPRHEASAISSSARAKGSSAPRLSAGPKKTKGSPSWRKEWMSSNASCWRSSAQIGLPIRSS